MSTENNIPKFIVSHDYKYIYHTQNPRLLFSLFYDAAEMDERGGELF